MVFARSALRCILLLSAASASIAQAQTLPQSTSAQVSAPDEDIVVTGSLIAGSTSAPSPIQVIGQEEIRRQGAATIWDIFKNLDINTGSTTNNNAG